LGAGFLQGLQGRAFLIRENRAGGAAKQVNLETGGAGILDGMKDADILCQTADPEPFDALLP